MRYPKIPVMFLAAALSVPTLTVADDDEEEPFDEAFLFFELNDTDGDLGLHGKIDGGPWKKMEIEGPDGPNERSLLKVRAKGPLRRQGMSELFFESAEPCFDPEDCDDALDPEDFFARFPQGEYEVEGKTLEGEELESEVILSHIIPAAPDEVMVNDSEAAEDCDEGLPVVSRPVVLSWSSAQESHEELGREGPIQIRYYEVVVEVDESDFKSSSIIPRVPDDDGRVSWTIPDDFFELTDEDEYKFEILTRTNVHDQDDELVIVEIDGESGPVPGNKSAVESCFELE